MIRLHRIAHQDEPLWVNPDLVLAIESKPDTVVTLTTHTRLIVCESPEEVVEAIREWRVSVLDALARPAAAPAVAALALGAAARPPSHRAGPSPRRTTVKAAT